MPTSQIAKAILPLTATDFITYSPQIQVMIQDTLRTLANIDFEHELDFEKLDRSDTRQELKTHIAGKLKERHAQRREPYLRLLAELQTRITSPAMAQA